MFDTTLIKRSIATTAIVVAGMPAAAQARLNLEGPTPPVSSPVVQQPQVVNGSTGFDWGDAGIGAAGGMLLLAAGAGSATAARRRRSARTA